MSKASNAALENQRVRRAGGNAPISVGDIKVEGDVNGNIVIGHGNRILQYVVNKQYGTVINNHSRPAVKLRDVKPQPPRLPIDFVGREAELEKLEQHIKARNAVFLFGHEGIGKTTLIKKAANSDAAAGMQDGVLFLEGVEEQGQLSGFEDLLQKLFDALHESDPHLKVDKAVARTYLSNTKPLVLIDRSEIPGSLLGTIPDYFPKGAVVVTGRNSIQTDAFESIGLSPLSRDDSINLLATKSGLDRSVSNLSLMNDVCAQLADVPLAITTIARAIHQQKITLSAVPNQLKRLKSPSEDKTQAAIEQCYALVYSLLNREERDALVAAAAASGISADRDILASIAGNEATNSLEDLELLTANSPRLRLPDGLIGIVRSASTNEILFREKFLDRITKHLRSKGLDFEFISDELGNLLGLIRWAENEKRWSDVITLGRAIDPYLTLHGLWDAWQVVLQQILSAADQLSDPATRAWALHQLGTRVAGYGNLSQAKSFLEQALELRKSTGDEVGAAYTQHNLWVLFPPAAFRRKPGDGLAVGRSGLVWIIPVLIVIAAIILGMILNQWHTYTNNTYGFRFKYPPDATITEYEAVRESVVASLRLPTNREDRFEKFMNVRVNSSPEEYPCRIPINAKEWVVESLELNNVQFLRAINTNQAEASVQYEIYATRRDENTWVCLEFTYSARETVPQDGPPLESGTSDETDMFREIAETFKWLAPPPIVTPLTPATTAPPPTKFEGEIINSPIPVTTTAAPPTITPTFTPTETPSPTPTYTNTPCIPQPGWFVYVVQYGDTLFQISLWYSNQGITVADIQKANCKLTTDIYASERLLVPGAPPPATIAGYVFADPNQNLVQDPGEQRLSNVSVSLTNANGTIVDTTVTDRNGEYEFSGVPYGYYYVFQFQVYVRPDQVVERNFGVVPAN